MNTQENVSGQKVAIISYFTIIGAIIAISMNNNTPEKFSRFHVRQAFGIHLLFHGFALFISQWFGFWSALQGTQKLLPIIGNYFQKWFTFIK
jgi:hypothetical protein